MKSKYIHIHVCFIIVPALPSTERSCFSLWSSAPALFVSVSSLSLLSLPSDFPKSKPLKNCLMAEGCSFFSSGAHFFPWNCFITKSNGERFGLSSSCLSWEFWSSFRRSADRIRFRNVYSCLSSFTMADTLRICHHCLHPTIYHSHDISIQEQSTYNYKKLRHCLKFGINMWSQLYSLEIQKLHKPIYLNVYAQLQSCFPWLWFPAVERHSFKQRTYLSFPWVHLRIPLTLFSFYSSFRVCETGEPWHANKSSLLSLKGTFHGVFTHKVSVFISLTAAALHKWFVGSFLMPLLLCSLSQSLPFPGLRNPFKCSDHFPA